MKKPDRYREIRRKPAVEPAVGLIMEARVTRVESAGESAFAVRQALVGLSQLVLASSGHARTSW